MDDNNNNNNNNMQVSSYQNLSLVSLLGRGTGLSQSQVSYELERLREFYNSTSEKQKDIIIKKFTDLITNINSTLIYLLLAIFSLILGVKLVNQGEGGGSKKSKKSRKSRK